jgi:pimeloyl-ACP methyl ester carboxylesterase
MFREKSIRRAAHLKYGIIKIYPGLDHHLHLDAPQQIAPDIISFLKTPVSQLKQQQSIQAKL